MMSTPWMMLGTCIKPSVRLRTSLESEAIRFDLPAATIF